MSGLKIPEYRVPVEQLRVGVFIRLEGIPWYKHPFLMNSFKIKNMEQVQTLLELGIKEVICVPEKSDNLPNKPNSKKSVDKRENIAPAMEEKSKSISDKMWKIKQERTEKLKKKKEKIAQCEKKYQHSLKEVSGMMQGVVGGNPESVGQALSFVDEMSKFFLQDTESTLHLMNLASTEESIYYHSLNVTVLAMMLAKECGVGAESMKALGMGSLFHDIGKSRIEKKILRKNKSSLTKPEIKLIMLHPRYGIEILGKNESFPKEALPIIYQHHERMNSRGYPEGIVADKISKLTRIVSICDVYDNHCNHVDTSRSLTPYQALSYMFTKQKALFDQNMLAMFIRCMGIYPPGTVVQLSNGSIGMVISVNPKNQLWPSIVIYDPEIPKKEALILDLEEEPDIKVEKSIRPAHLPKEIFRILEPQDKNHLLR